MIFFIIPAYNEEENIAYLLDSVADKMRRIGRPYRMVVVDDGSRDGTNRIARERSASMPVVIVEHKINQGVGQVFRSGFKYAAENAAPGDIVITKESDNTGDLNILDDMIKKIDSGADVVLASCYAKGGRIVGAPFDRVLMSAAANAMLKILFPVRGASTYSSFYRAYRAEVIKNADAAYGGKLIEEGGFACMAEVLIKLGRLPVRISEIPMTLKYGARKGKSKMNKTKTILAYLRLIASGFRCRNCGGIEPCERYIQITGNRS